MARNEIQLTYILFWLGDGKIALAEFGIHKIAMPVVEGDVVGITNFILPLHLEIPIGRQTQRKLVPEDPVETLYRLRRMGPYLSLSRAAFMVSSLILYPTSGHAGQRTAREPELRWGTYLSMP